MPRPEKELARGDEERIVADAIVRLPEPQRPLVRRYLGDETIAADLGLSKIWANRVLGQALKTLRRERGHLR